MVSKARKVVDGVVLKRCPRCEEWKPLDAWYRWGEKQRFSPRCKTCSNTFSREYAKAHRDQVNANHRRRYAENPEKEKEWNKKYRERHRNPTQRTYKEAGRDRRLERQARERLIGRRCSICRELKPLDQFSPNAYRCKPCNSKYVYERYCLSLNRQSPARIGRPPKQSTERS